MRTTDARISMMQHVWMPAALAFLLVLVVMPRSASAQGIGLQELRHMMSWGRTSLILFDKLEYAPQVDGAPVELDATGWYGGAYNRLWFRLDGEQLTTERVGEGEAHAYFGRLISPYWDALAGVRVDQRWGEDPATRAHLGVGVTGLAPLTFEFTPTLFVSHRGDVSARLEAEYHMLITQRLVATPEVQLNAALQDVPEWGVGSGFNDVGLGLRLRYEIIREFAPYVGVSWLRRMGGTADLARDHGEAASAASVVVGVRMWR